MTNRLGSGVLFAAALIALAQCAGAQRNVLVLVLDDVGVDNVGAYGEGLDLPPTPNIDALAKGGVLFRNVWANPLCSPTRATVQTGRYSFRTGVGHVPPFGPALPQAELTIPEVLDLAGSPYERAAFGKWHLGEFLGASDDPIQQGYGHYAGALGGNLVSYYQFTKSVDGELMEVNTYATTDTVDDAVSWIHGRPGPWFCWVAFNGAHSPFHSPPPDLHTQELPTSLFSLVFAPRPFYRAMVEAVDTEIGRLLASIEPSVLENTTVILLGDNGTPNAVSVPPFVPAHAKGTIYEGGVNVPLIISGRNVAAPGREVEALVNTTDLFATILELAGVDLAKALPVDRKYDSVSLLPYLLDPLQPRLRQAVYAEVFLGAGPGIRAIRDERYKLILFGDGTMQLFDLVLDPFELASLL